MILTDGELQEALRVSRVTLWRLRKAGALPFFKVGGQYRYRSEDIDRWLGETRFKDLVQLALPLGNATPTTQPVKVDSRGRAKARVRR
jgi:excisionase family DNA binding protein